MGRWRESVAFGSAIDNQRLFPDHHAHGRECHDPHLLIPSHGMCSGRGPHCCNVALDSHFFDLRRCSVLFHTYIHSYLRTFILAYSHTYTHSYIHYIHSCLHTFIHTYIHSNLHTQEHKLLPTKRHIHAHTHTHTHTQNTHACVCARVYTGAQALSCHTQVITQTTSSVSESQNV